MALHEFERDLPTVSLCDRCGRRCSRYRRRTQNCGDEKQQEDIRNLAEHDHHLEEPDSLISKRRFVGRFVRREPLNSASFVTKTRESETKKEEIGSDFGGIHAAKIIPD